MRGLPETAAPGGALVVASPIKLRPGEESMVPVTVTNPFPEGVQGVARLGETERAFAVPGRGKVQLALPVRVPDNAAVGWLELPPGSPLSRTGPETDDAGRRAGSCR